MKPFAFTVAIGLACAASLIYWADPPGRWHRLQTFPDHELRAGDVWHFEGNLDSRAQRFNHIRWMQKPDIVFFGSSRVMKVASSMFGNKIRLANLGIHYPVISDYADLWERLIESNKRPAHLVVFVDPWILNAHHTPPVQALPRWKDTRQTASYVREASTFLFHQATEFLRASELRHALQMLLGQTKVETSGRGLRWDGSLEDATSPMTSEALQDRVRHVYSIRKNSPFIEWQYDPKKGKALETFLKDVTVSGTRVKLVLPPYQTAAYKRFAQLPVEAKGMLRYRQGCAGVAQAVTNVTVCDAVSPEVIGCGATEFQDEHHMQDSCVAKLLSFCFSDAQDLRNFIQHSGR